MTITCPHCHKDVELWYSRHIWVTGSVQEIDDEGNPSDITDDEYGDEDESFYMCSECNLSITTAYVLKMAVEDSDEEV